MSKTPMNPKAEAPKPKARKRSEAPKSPSRKPQTKDDLLLEIGDLRLRLDEAVEALTAIRTGDVDALVVSGPKGDLVYALKGAEQPYRILVESMNEGALSLTEAGIIMNSNKAFSNITGISCGNLVGKPFKELVSKDDAEKFNTFWKKACEEEERAEIALRIGDRTIPIFMSAGARLIDGECWVFAVVTDITERKKTEAELTKYRDHLEKLVEEKTLELKTTNEELQAVNERLQTTNDDLLKLTEDMDARNRELEMLNKELDAFAYSVSHDLRAPLRVMEGFSKIVLETYTDKLDEEGKNYLTRIRFSAERMSQLIEDLLRLSRISRQEIRRMDYSLSGIASSVVHGLRQADPARNVEVVVQEGMRANVDPDLMRIAIFNLLSNAWKFSSKSENARIEFGVIERDGKTTYFVKDNGAGFDPGFADKLFLPFQRLHTEAEFEGTGIGLSIVERIIRRHGGKVWAEGGVGKGAAFYFTLE